MQTLAQRAIAYDRYLEVPNMPEWSDSDINRAIECLEYDILENDLDWDEDGDYHKDYAIDVIRILRTEDKDEQLILIKEAYIKSVHNYCVSAVKRDPAYYCAEYCE